MLIKHLPHLFTYELDKYLLHQWTNSYTKFN